MKFSGFQTLGDGQVRDVVFEAAGWPEVQRRAYRCGLSDLAEVVSSVEVSDGFIEALRPLMAPLAPGGAK